MAAISGGTGYDYKYIGWWTRMFNSPKCRYCKERMVCLDDPYVTTWQCKTCDWIIFHAAEERIGLWERFLTLLEKVGGPTDTNV